MRKVVCIAFIFLNSSFCLNAQRTSNIWYFGKGVGLNFNNNPPTPLTGGALTSIESCSSVADKNGNLLFYTNGVSVNNRKKELMIGGVPIGGDMSSTNGAVIIPFHGNDSLYYIFTRGAASQDEQNLAYSIVNINRDGGYGEVIQKNNIIEDKIIEKLTVVSHCNKKDFWVIVRKWNTDEYHSYLVTSTGINSTPVVSHTGLVVSGAETNAIGVLKSSTNNKKLAAVHGFQNDLVELMDFDNTTSYF
ncbi:MAG: hypothetical protein IPP48_03750 [Chitinophagaceae bacterium]|nr:hypothetical protein [Chitinophagaceae bacterium]